MVLAARLIAFLIAFSIEDSDDPTSSRIL